MRAQDTAQVTARPLPTTVGIKRAKGGHKLNVCGTSHPKTGKRRARVGVAVKSGLRCHRNGETVGVKGRGEGNNVRTHNTTAVHPLQVRTRASATPRKAAILSHRGCPLLLQRARIGGASNAVNNLRRSGPERPPARCCTQAENERYEALGLRAVKRHQPRSHHDVAVRPLQVKGPLRVPLEHDVVHAILLERSEHNISHGMQRVLHGVPCGRGNGGGGEEGMCGGDNFTLESVTPKMPLPIHVCQGSVSRPAARVFYSGQTACSLTPTVPVPAYLF